jgi:hypothetical protein
MIKVGPPKKTPSSSSRKKRATKHRDDVLEPVAEVGEPVVEVAEPAMEDDTPVDQRTPTPPLEDADMQKEPSSPAECHETDNSDGTYSSC